MKGPVLQEKMSRALGLGNVSRVLVSLSVPKSRVESPEGVERIVPHCACVSMARP